MKQTIAWPMAVLAVMVLLIHGSVCSAQKCEIDWTAQCDPRNPNQDRDETNGPVPIIDADDVIGYSADGNRVDEDDIAASPLALAIFAKRGWKNQLVHFSYNNCPMIGNGAKPAEHKVSVEGAATVFGYDANITKFFNCQVDSQWNAAVDHAVEVIKSTGNGKKFYWIQAGPHELAYRVLTQVKKDAPEKLQNVVLVSHSGVNNVSTHSIRSSLGEACGHTLRDCLALDDRIGYFFTSLQGGIEKFGSKKADEWAAVAWMKTVDCDAWNFVDKRFRKAQEMYDKPGLDASDAGMAYTLATGDPDGNFFTLTKWIDGWCPDSSPDPAVSTQDDSLPLNAVPKTDSAFVQETAGTEQPVFIEKDGLVVIEAEGVALPTGWERRSSINGYMGNGYVVYVDPNREEPSKEIIRYQFKISTTGTYEFAWRSRNGEGAVEGDKENDSWMKIIADSVTLMRKSDKSNYGDKFRKVHLASLGKWSWLGEKPRAEGPTQSGLRIFATFDHPGVYEFQISGRSSGHTIDRFVLWHSDVDDKYALYAARPESDIVGCRISNLPVKETQGK